MVANLFPELGVEDYILDVKYDGPSFNGVMEIGALTSEIAGFETCLKTIIAVLRKNNGLDLKEDDFQIVVEAFQNNCFRKRIKFVGKHLNKYPVAYTSIAAIMAALIAIVPDLGAKKIKEMGPDTMLKIADATKVELLRDPVFLRALANTVKPLTTEKDKVVFIQPVKKPNRTCTVNYAQKDEFLRLAAELEEVAEVVVPGEVYGRIISMDLDANKNQIDFKANGAGERIRCTLKDGMRIDDYVSLLGKWVLISGDIKSANTQVVHILIASIKPTPERRQEELAF